MNKILKITSTICAGNISLLTTVFAMDPNRNNGTFMPVNPNKYSISAGHENPFVHTDNSSVISNRSTTVSVTEEDPNMQQQIAQLAQNMQATPQIPITQPVPQPPANRQQVQNIQWVIPFHNGSIPTNRMNFMSRLGMGHPVPAHVAQQPYQWVLPGAVTVDFINPKHNEYLFEINQNGILLFKIFGTVKNNSYVSFETLLSTGALSSLPGNNKPNDTIRFYFCPKCRSVQWHNFNNHKDKANNYCFGCCYVSAPGANDRVFYFNRKLATQLCKNRALCAVDKCPVIVR